MKSLLDLFPAVKLALRGIFLRPGWYSDSHHKLERLFKNMRDPYNFESSPYEQDRLQHLLEEVKRYPHESVLEVGSAEGHFTCELAKISKRVVALDVSPTAITRAQERCKSPTYVLKSLDEFQTDEKFDLVVCAETLYYIKDIPKAIEKLSSLGRYCLVSYIERESKNLDPYFERVPLLVFKKFEKSYGLVKRAMTVVVWKNEKA